MPKIVDPVARRAQVGDAVLRVVGRAGVRGATLSAIAGESGLAIGSVRHYFSNHDEVLRFAMRELADRVDDRMQRHLQELAVGSVDLATFESFVGELLPLDDQRRLEANVWLAFVTASRSDPTLTEIAGRMGAGLRDVLGRVLAGAQRRGLLAFDDVDVEAQRLAAVVDGLTLAVIRPPGIDVATVRTVLRRHLRSLATGPARESG